MATCGVGAGSAPSIVYLVQNHRPPAQLARLVRALGTGSTGAFVVVVHDPHAGLATTAEVEHATDAPVLPTLERARRGYFSLVAPSADAVAWLAALRVGYDWLVYLSAQDYPARPLAELEALLARSEADGFLRLWRAFAPGPCWRRHQGELRYRLQYRDVGPALLRLLRLVRFLNAWQRWLHLHLAYGPRLGIRPRRSPFESGLECWGGTQWTTLRRAAAEHVAERVLEGGELVEWFRRTICPDEALVQTLLMAEGRFRLVDDDLRYVDFSGCRDGHPRTLRRCDLDSVIASGRIFARKLDSAIDPALLDALDEFRRGCAGSARLHG
ncbi:MAG TPA: beta-1,6-N-acetylglucosaminyltransferase [Candidatus Sulfomarinibacteraceae bacterium]|nr:beta-1,6-N-acetylglucosaminyltransferase [Candidatus Sulfomarinibacteraceae bacterium]